MQSVSARIWTRVTVSISFDDNHYTTGTSFLYITSIYIYVNVLLFRGARGVAVIVMEIDSVTRVQILSEAVCIS